MIAADQKAILTIALSAAFADGHNDDREREAIRGIADSLTTNADAIELSKVVQDVLLKRTSVSSAAATLNDPQHRLLAYEMAVCVCDADGRQNDGEKQFLSELKRLLQIESGQTASLDQDATAFLDATDQAVPLDSATNHPAVPSGAAGLAIPAGIVATAAMATATASTPAQIERDRALDKSILNYSYLNGALELLPQSWASMAIIPLQIKMVYEIGKAHGVNLDQGHIKEFIAAAGVGLTSQYLEQFGRKLLGGLLGKAAGKTFGQIGGAATGMAFSFATTYALGQVAKRYYAGGRTMTSAMLRDSFQNLLGPAKQMQADYLPQIQQKAASLDMNQVMNMIKGR